MSRTMNRPTACVAAGVAGVLLLAASPALAGFRYAAFLATRWGFTGERIGIADCTIESFEDVGLEPGLQVRVTTNNGSYGPTATLPGLFDQSTDPNGTAFNNSAWSGTKGLVNTATNASRPYGNVNNWGTVEFIFNPPVKIVGFSLQQANSALSLSINGVARGSLNALTGLPTSDSRNGYAIITATDNDSISSLVVSNNNNGDGYVFDHLAFSTTPSPNVTGLLNPPSQWGASDAALGIPHAVIEDFEDASLITNLQVEWDSPAGHVGPTSTLPNLFLTTVDPFGTAFLDSNWDGTHAIIDVSTNQPAPYSAVDNWGDLILRFATPIPSLGFSMDDMDRENTRVIVNGREVGTVQGLTGAPLVGRQGYLRFFMPLGESFSSLRLANARESFNDGLAIDHVSLGGCIADYDGSGGTPDSSDIDAFFQDWLAGDPASDVDGSGGSPDSTDIDLFFRAWLAGGC